MSAVAISGKFDVELPAGGVLHLQTPEEVNLWEVSLDKYREDYNFIKQNDLFTLGALLQQQIVLFRAQTAINGMKPKLDQHGVPTGDYERVEMDPSDMLAAQKAITAASSEMRALEKQLGIDKATRESGGAHTVDNYLTELKRAAHERGIHLSKRMLAYEKFVMEMRWKLRMLYNSDVEDRRYHNITPKTVLDWELAEVDRLAQVDAEYAKTIHKVFLGKL